MKNETFLDFQTLWSWSTSWRVAASAGPPFSTRQGDPALPDFEFLFLQYFGGFVSVLTTLVYQKNITMFTFKIPRNLRKNTKENEEVCHSHLSFTFDSINLLKKMNNLTVQVEKNRRAVSNYQTTVQASFKLDQVLKQNW